MWSILISAEFSIEWYKKELKVNQKKMENITRSQ